MIKTLTLSLFTLLLAFSLPAQDLNIAAAGVSSDGAKVAGTAMYAKRLTEAGTYAFTVMDAVPTTVRPLTVTTSYSAGVAQKILTMGRASVYIPTAAGVSYAGGNTGWAWSTGALASVPINSTWRVLPNVRVVKSSVSGGTGYQVIGGVMFGWGW